MGIGTGPQTGGGVGMKLVPNWKQGWKWLSVHLMAIGAAFTATWVAVPETMRAFLPDKWAHMAAMVTFLAGLAARFISQPTKPVPPETDDKDNP